MSHKHTRLAVLISAIGLGIPATQRAVAGDSGLVVDDVARAPMVEREQAVAIPMPQDAQDESLPQDEPGQSGELVVASDPVQPSREPQMQASEEAGTSTSPQPPEIDSAETYMDRDRDVAGDIGVREAQLPLPESSGLSSHEYAVPQELTVDADVSDESASWASTEAAAPSMTADEPMLETEDGEHAPADPAVPNTPSPILAGREPGVSATDWLPPSERPQPQPKEASSKEALRAERARDMPEGDATHAAEVAQPRVVEDEPAYMADEKAAADTARPAAQRPRGLLAKLGHLLRRIFLGGAPAAGEAPVAAHAKQAWPGGVIRMVAGVAPVSESIDAGADDGVHAQRVLTILAAVRSSATARMEQPDLADLADGAHGEHDSTARANVAQVAEEGPAHDAPSQHEPLFRALDSQQPMQPEPAAVPGSPAPDAPQAQAQPGTHDEEHAVDETHAMVDLPAAFEPPKPTDLAQAATTAEDEPLRSSEAAASLSPLPGVTVAMSEQRLDRVRGGFMAPSGLQVSFGIERAVYINGSLVTTTTLNLAPGQAEGAQMQMPSAGQFTFIQNGAGNTVVPGAIAADTLPTVIQNTLDGQKIQNLTVINATVNSLQVLKGLQLQSAVTSAIIDSLRR